MYEQPYHPSQYPQGRPDSRGGAKRSDYRGSQAFGWKPSVFEQPSYGPYPGPANAYQRQQSQDSVVPLQFGRGTPGGLGPQQQQPQVFPEANVSPPYGPGSVASGGFGPQQQKPQGYSDPNVSSPYGPGSTTPGGLGPQQQKLQGYSDPNVSSPYGPVSAPPPSTAAPSIVHPQPHVQAGYGAVGQGGYRDDHQTNVPYSQQGPVPYPAQQQPVQQQPVQQQPVQQQPVQQQLHQRQSTSPLSYQAEPVQTPPTQPVQAQAIQPLQPQPVHAHQQPTQVPHVQQPAQAQPAQQPTQVQHLQQPAQAQPAQQPTQVQLVQQQPAQAQPAPEPTQTQPLQQPPVQSQPVQQDLFSQLENGQPLQQLPIQAQPETLQAQTEPQTHIRASSGPHSVSPQRQVQAQPLSQVQPQPQAQLQVQVQPQPQAQPEPQQKQQQQPPAGPPYIYDPNTTYADPNVQAWAQYYAQGGRDLAGSVYFISIPGLKENSSPGSTQSNAQQSQQAQQGGQHAQQGQQQAQSYLSQSRPSEMEMELSFSATTTRQQQEQPSQLHGSQFTQPSQFQPQRVQDQILSQPDLQRRSLSLRELENPYKQRQSSIGDVEASSPIDPRPRSTTLGMGRGTRLSSGSIDGEQTGIGIAAPSNGASAAPSWVLPKKTPPATVAGGSPGQFRGVSLTDPGSAERLGRGPTNQGA